MSAVCSAVCLWFVNCLFCCVSVVCQLFVLLCVYGLSAVCLVVCVFVVYLWFINCWLCCVCMVYQLFVPLCRGCLQNLTRLDVSGNIYKKPLPKDLTVPTAWKEFFLMSCSLQFVNLSNTRLPPAALKYQLIATVVVVIMKLISQESH